MFELNARIRSGEMPVNGDGFLVAPLLPYAQHYSR
jgi:hypothetical protein